MVENKSIYSKKPKINSVIENLEMDFSKLLEKPFPVGTATWTTSNVPGTEIIRIPIPSGFLKGTLGQYPFYMSTFYDMNLCAMLQTSGTPMHQGMLLAAVIPHYAPAITHPNNLLSAPHAFMFANESTPVCLDCPMYISANLGRCFDPATMMTIQEYGELNVCDLVVIVVNQLAAPTGGSTTLSVSIMADFKDSRFFVPKPGNMIFQAQTKERKPINSLSTIMDYTAEGIKKVAGDLIDLGRSAIRSYTGLHNNNNAVITGKQYVTFRNTQVQVDGTTQLENLDIHPYYARIYDDYYFRTDVDEMDVRYLCSKPMYIGTFQVNASDTIGQNLFAHPISPMIEVNDYFGTVYPTYFAPMRMFYEMSRFWSGNLKLHIQMVGSNFHFCKLLIFKNYATFKEPFVHLTNIVPDYEEIHNSNIDVLEFSAGGQTHVIDLPFCSNYNQIECTKDYSANATLHGMVYGYLNQPLVTNGSVNSSVQFNVYMSGGDNLEFAGFSTDFIDTTGVSIPIYPPLPTSSKILEEDIYQAQSKEGDGINPVTVDTATQEVLSPIMPEDYNHNTISSIHPNVSVRDYVRMLYPSVLTTISPTTKENFYVFDPLIWLGSGDGSLNTMLSAIYSSYLGFTGGLKLKIKILNVAGASVFYKPPGIYASTSPSGLASSAGYVASNGALQLDYAQRIAFNPTNLPFSLPTQEINDYTRPYSGTGSGSASSTVGNNFVFDLKIPNYNMCNYVGSAKKYYTGQETTSVENDMGEVYVTFTAAYDGSSYGKATIIVYVGFGDEARFGFQVYNPIKTIPGITLNGTKFRQSVYTGNSFGIVVSSAPSSFYYFKIT